MGFLNENYNRGALEFFQFILSGHLALQSRASPASWNFLAFAAIFVALWAKRNWFCDKFNARAFINMCMGMALAQAITMQMDAAHDSYQMILRWTLFSMFAMQWLIHTINNLPWSN